MLKQSLFGLVLFLSSNCLHSLKAEQLNDHSTQPTQVLVFGDSLSAAYNIKQDQGWPSLLQDFVNANQLKLNIINASISGETTSGGLQRLPAQLKRTNPQIVIIELGGNDGLRGFDLATTRNNLMQMIELARAHGASVILAGIQMPPNYGRTYTQRFSQIYQDLGQIEHVVLIPFILEGVATDKSLMQQDGIHPNEKGQPKILATVWPYLAELLNLN